MPNIESIRPGEVLESNFAEYALPELLIGILRGNLSGLMEVSLHPTRPNFVCFKEGVPVAVVLPDAEVSLSRLLAAQGELARARIEEIERWAAETGETESRVISKGSLVSEGALREGIRRRARAQLVKLFDVGDRSFRFVEGAPMPPDAELSILQPLPVIFEGLISSRNRAPVASFLHSHQNARFRLSDTYPRGIDPFEWGERIERVVSEMTDVARTFDDLARRGLSLDEVGVVLTTLSLADMVEITSAPATRHSAPAPSKAARHTADDLAGPTQPLDLELDRAPVRPPLVEVIPRAALAPKLPSVPLSSAVQQDPAEAAPRLSAPPRDQPPSADHEAERAAVAKKLDPLRGKNYYEVIRVGPASPADQIDRAYRFLMKQPNAQDSDAGTRAWRDHLEEAYRTISDPIEGPKYRDLVEKSAKQRFVRERLALEATPKVQRAALAMAEGRTGEAAYLLAWAQDLDPFRRDLRLHRAYLAFARSAPADRAAVAKVMRPMLAPEAGREEVVLTLYFAVALATLGEDALARDVLAKTRDGGHPLRAVAERLLTARRSSRLPPR